MGVPPVNILILLGFSMINHPFFWGIPIYGNPLFLAQQKKNQRHLFELERSPWCDAERSRPSAAASDKAPARPRPRDMDDLMPKIDAVNIPFGGMVYTNQLIVRLGMMYC